MTAEKRSDCLAYVVAFTWVFLRTCSAEPVDRIQPRLRSLSFQLEPASALVIQPVKDGVASRLTSWQVGGATGVRVQPCHIDLVPSTAIPSCHLQARAASDLTLMADSPVGGAEKAPPVLWTALVLAKVKSTAEECTPQVELSLEDWRLRARVVSVPEPCEDDAVSAQATLTLARGQTAELNATSPLYVGDASADSRKIIRMRACERDACAGTVDVETPLRSEGAVKLQVSDIPHGSLFRKREFARIEVEWGHHPPFDAGWLTYCRTDVGKRAVFHDVELHDLRLHAGDHGGELLADLGFARAEGASCGFPISRFKDKLLSQDGVFTLVVAAVAFVMLRGRRLVPGIRFMSRVRQCMYLWFRRRQRSTTQKPSSSGHPATSAKPSGSGRPSGAETQPAATQPSATKPEVDAAGSAASPRPHDGRPAHDERGEPAVAAEGHSPRENATRKS